MVRNPVVRIAEAVSGLVRGISGSVVRREVCGNRICCLCAEFLVEAYPGLKADESYLRLQRELALTEDRIAAARRFFNGSVRDMNVLREGIPQTSLAGSSASSRRASSSWTMRPSASYRGSRGEPRRLGVDVRTMDSNRDSRLQERLSVNRR